MGDWNTLDTLVLPPILLLAAFAAWGDLRPMLPYLIGRTGYAGALHGRIPIRVQAVWLVSGFILSGLFLFAEDLGLPALSPGYIEFAEGIPYAAAMAMNSVLALLVGILLWIFGLWAAGDAKVFALISFTLPLVFYQNNYISWFPSFVVLFNTFVMLFIILLVEFLVITGRAIINTRGGFLVEKFSALGKSVMQKGWGILRLVIVFLALFTTVRILRHFLREGIESVLHLNKTLIFLILFLIFKPITRLAEKTWALLASIMIVVSYLGYALFLDESGEALYEFVNIGWLTLALILFRAIYDAYLKATDEVMIPWQDLRAGMILGPTTQKRFEERREFFSTQLISLSPDGLTPGQVESLKQWFSENGPEELVALARTIPFVPALFLGLCITIILRGLIIVL